MCPRVPPVRSDPTVPPGKYTGGGNIKNYHLGVDITTPRWYLVDMENTTYDALDDAPTWEPIRLPVTPSATKWACNPNWNRRGAHAAKATR